MAMAGKRRTKLGILFGGRSGEHEVSLTSATSLITALDPEEFEICAIGITKGGKLADRDEVRRMLPAHLHGRIEMHSGLVAYDSRMRLLPPAATGDNNHESRSPEIIFPLLHGPYGEDGTIQGLLEIAGLPYVGCGVLASAVGMDKDVMKRLFLQAGLPTLPFRVLAVKDLAGNMDRIRREIEAEFTYPVFSKPANLGSSVGVVKIHDSGKLAEALQISAQFDSKVIVEQGIDARELECAILGNDEPEASGVGEVIPAREFYDYQAKYDDPNSRVEIPAQVSDSVAEEIRDIAIRAFKCIGGSGLARVDFFLERRNSKVWLNEINTMPGFTPISMFPKLWAARGLSFGELVSRLVELGLERHRQRLRQRVS